jgi:hypothetical protein
MLIALAACGSGNAGKNKSDKSVTVGIVTNYYYFKAWCFNERIKSVNINNIGYECLGDITFN